MGKKAALLLGRILLVWFTILIAGLCIIGWFAGVVPPTQSWAVALIGLGMLPLLALGVILIVVWACMKSFWALFPLGAILLNIGFLCSMFQMDFRDQDKLPQAELMIATYNIHGYSHKDYTKTIDDVLNLTNLEGVDVVCMQEFNENERWATDTTLQALAPSYPYRAAHKQTRNMQLIVFSRYPIVESRLIPFTDSYNSAMWVDINVAGRVVRLFNVHLETTSLSQSQREIGVLKTVGLPDQQSEQAVGVILDRLSKGAIKRAAQVALVRQSMDSKPTIVCGDFNDIPSSYTYNSMKEGLQDGFRTAGSGYGYTFQEMLKLLRVDYILYSKEFLPITYCSPKWDYSDHNPVLMKMAFVH